MRRMSTLAGFLATRHHFRAYVDEMLREAIPEGLLCALDPNWSGPVCAPGTPVAILHA